jgi:hypothetical protein
MEDYLIALETVLGVKRSSFLDKKRKNETKR